MLPVLLPAQETVEAVPEGLTLEKCIEYALTNRPAVEQSRIDEAIGKNEIQASLSQWLPQVSAQYDVSHNFNLRTTAFGNNLITIGRENNSDVVLQATQTLYSRDALIAAQSARYIRQQLDLGTEESKINAVVAVSKSFYDILLTRQQQEVLEQNIIRLEKQYQDALSQYESGIVDKTDYQRARIALSNVRSDLRRTEELLNAKYAVLKELMGYAPDEPLNIAFDYESMEEDVLLDTTQALNYINRVEVQQLLVQQELQELNTNYYRWGFLPTVSAYYNYNWVFLNDELSELYSEAYPTSLVGLQVTLPIFQGTRRIQNLQVAKLQEERLELTLEEAELQINTQYETALANYKSDLTEWLTQRENMQLAEEVYDILKLQYDEGIKTYLDLIVAETDLREAQVSYYNALYNVLASKLDFERAIGGIEVQ